MNMYQAWLDKKPLSNDGWDLLSHQHPLNCLAWGLALPFQVASLEICPALSDIHPLYCEKTGKACHSVL